jgi:hypothetical protein
MAHMETQTLRWFKLRRRLQTALLVASPLLFLNMVIVTVGQGDAHRIGWWNVFIIFTSSQVLVMWLELLGRRKFLGCRVARIYLKPETEQRIKWLALQEAISVNQWVARTVGEQAKFQFEAAQE